MTPMAGFGTKSFIGGDSVLLDASEATNFRYGIGGCTDDVMQRVNRIGGGCGIRSRIAAIRSSGCTIDYLRCPDRTFDRNLRILDGDLGRIIGEMMYRSCSEDRLDRLSAITDGLERDDPFHQGIDGWYRIKIKKLLSRIALGMTPTADWNGEEESYGRYIVADGDGGTACFPYFERSAFEEYLLNHTELGHGGADRHGYAAVYRDPQDGYCIDLNLQIRFATPRNGHRAQEQLTPE